MLEIMIERWSNRDGTEDFIWSAWRDGERLHMGGPHGDAAAAEGEGRRYCLSRFGAEPDQIVRL